jgi:WD40 repeat protein
VEEEDLLLQTDII